jgi:hypothetical protein
MTDTVNIRKISSRLTPQQEDKLRKLAADPEALDPLGRQIREDIERRAAEREAEMAAIERAAAERRALNEALVSAVGDVLGKVSATLRALNDRLDSIQRADRERLVLAACNTAYWRNGGLHFSKEKFMAALAAGGTNDE